MEITKRARCFKAGAYAGFIYGITSGILAFFLLLFLMTEEIMKVAIIATIIGIGAILSGIFAGVIFGLIYGERYSRLPGRNSTIKAIWIGLIWWLITLPVWMNFTVDLGFPVVIGMSIIPAALYVFSLAHFWDKFSLVGQIETAGKERDYNKLMKLGFSFLGDIPSLGAESVYQKEEWVSGTKLITFLYIVRKHKLTTDDISSELEAQLVFARKNKRTWLFRGICAYVIIPIYITENPSKDVTNMVSKKQPKQWAIFHEPVVYDSISNAVFYGKKPEWWGILFWDYIQNAIETAISDIQAEIKTSSMQNP